MNRDLEQMVDARLANARKDFLKEEGYPVLVLGVREKDEKLLFIAFGEVTPELIVPALESYLTAARKLLINNN